jgi:hypothetical protein
MSTPGRGTPPGQDAYKIRVKITSKGKGNSGGARLITFVETGIISQNEKVSDEEGAVNLLTIFDKGE